MVFITCPTCAHSAWRNSSLRSRVLLRVRMTRHHLRFTLLPNDIDVPSRSSAPERCARCRGAFQSHLMLMWRLRRISLLPLLDLRLACSNLRPGRRRFSMPTECGSTRRSTPMRSRVSPALAECVRRAGCEISVSVPAKARCDSITCKASQHSKGSPHHRESKTEGRFLPLALPFEHLRARITALEVPQVQFTSPPSDAGAEIRRRRQGVFRHARMRSARVSIERMIVQEVFGSQLLPKATAPVPSTSATMALEPMTPPATRSDDRPRTWSTST